MSKKLNQQEAMIRYADKISENTDLYEFRAAYALDVVDLQDVFPRIPEDFVANVVNAEGAATPWQARAGTASLLLFDMFTEGLKSLDDADFDWASKHVANTTQLNAMTVQLGRVVVPIVATNSNLRRSLTISKWVDAAVRPFIFGTPESVEIEDFTKRFKTLYSRMTYGSESTPSLVNSNYMVSGVSGLRSILSRWSGKEMTPPYVERVEAGLDVLSSREQEGAIDQSEKMNVITSELPKEFSVRSLSEWQLLASKPNLADQLTSREAYIDGARTLKAVGAFLEKKSGDEKVGQLLKVLSACLTDPDKVVALANTKAIKSINSISDSASDVDKRELGLAGERLVDAFVRLGAQKITSKEEMMLVDSAKVVVASRFSRASRA